MLHIHNGDSTAGTMRESGFPGEHLAFREVLACRRDFLGIHPFDMWLGGVHLTRDNLWRWDGKECRLQSHKS